MSDHNTTAGSAQEKQRSRLGKHPLTGFFDPSVLKAWKTLAVQLDTTVQVLFAIAINDKLEKHGLGRPADETALPRGGAAHRRRKKKTTDG